MNETLTLTLLEKMAQIQGIAVAKTAENPFFKSKYATLDSVVKLLKPFIEEHNLLITHKMEVMEGIPGLVTIVYDLDNKEDIHSFFPVYSQDPQKCGAGMTYGRRYNLVSLFNLLTEKDDDGNTASGLEEKGEVAKAKKEIEECKSIEALRELYKKYASLGEEVQTLITKRKNQLTKQQ